MIAVQNLTKRYGDITAIDNISFEVKKGEILGFLGQNGAGKTTTMRILTGFLPATSGKVEIAGYDVFDQPMKVKECIGYMPETPPLYEDMTVHGYLTFVTKIKGMKGWEGRERVEWVIEKCNLKTVAKRLVQNLSKGYRQRVGLAGALVHNPKVLILDEPTVGLDPKQINEIRELIVSLKGDHSIILSTHILPEVALTCDRAIIINHGKIVVDRPLSDFKTGQSLEAAFLGAIMSAPVMSTMSSMEVEQ